MVLYFDHAASTPVHPAAVLAMTEVLTECYGNPSGSHRLARQANIRVDSARAALARVFGLDPGNIVFTSGGTEADSLAINGSLRAASQAGRDSVAVCTAVEHHAILDPVQQGGGHVVGVSGDGVLDLAALRTLLDKLRANDVNVAIVSIMAANNETGVVQPVIEAAALVRELAPDALVHSDAVQYSAWYDPAELFAAVDLMSVSAHKFGGPKGVGFLAIRTGIDLPPIQVGGSQERGRRGGTQNVPGIVAMAAAAEAMATQRLAAAGRVRDLRNRLEIAIVEAIPDAVVSGGGVERLPNIAHLSFAGVESEPLLFMLERCDVMASAASSCASGAQQASHVLAAMGGTSAEPTGVIRLSLGYQTTAEEVETAAAAVVDVVKRIRSRG